MVSLLECLYLDLNDRKTKKQRNTKKVTFADFNMASTIAKTKQEMKTGKFVAKADKSKVVPLSEEQLEKSSFVGIDLGVRYTASCVAYDYGSNEMKTLLVKASSISRHTREFSKWLEARKKRSVENGFDVFEAERKLERDPTLNRETFAKHWTKTFDSLHEFYNAKRVKGKRFNAKQRKIAEMNKAHHGIFRMLGGNCSDKRGNENRFIILGDAGFDAQGGLHNTFEKKLVGKARALGYKVMVVDEYFTSQKCSRCGDQCQSIGMRVKHCSSCDIYFHRDLLGGENMCRVGESSLKGLDRPEDLKRPADPKPAISTQKTTAKRKSTTDASIRRTKRLRYVQYTPIICSLFCR